MCSIVFFVLSSSGTTGSCFTQGHCQKHNQNFYCKWNSKGLGRHSFLHLNLRTFRHDTWVCGPASVLAMKSETCPSLERTFTPSITPLPATQLDSGQCAKQLWKRPHVISLIECPFRDVFSYSLHFYQKYRTTHPLLSCKTGFSPSMTWWSSSGLN